MQCGTTSVLHRDLKVLAELMQRAIAHAGYVRAPLVTSQALTRRLVLSAEIDSDDPATALAIAKSVLLSHLYEHGPEYRRVGIHHAEAMPLP